MQASKLFVLKSLTIPIGHGGEVVSSIVLVADGVAHPVNLEAEDANSPKTLAYSNAVPR
jgi:hypothetical protein